MSEHRDDSHEPRSGDEHRGDEHSPSTAHDDAARSASAPTGDTGGSSGGSAPPPPPGRTQPGAQYDTQDPAHYAAERKPDLVNAIAIFNLVDGILNILFAASWFLGITVFGVSTLGCGCLFLPLGLYPLILGILELMYGARLLPAEPREVTPARWLAVMQIVNILLGQVVSAVGGILTLVFLDNPEVRRWFAQRAPRPPAGYGGDTYR